jgi:hypothetical protein
MKISISCPQAGPSRRTEPVEVVDLFDEDDDEELSRALEASRCEWEGLQKVSLQPRFEGE